MHALAAQAVLSVMVEVVGEVIVVILIVNIRIKVLRHCWDGRRKASSSNRLWLWLLIALTITA